MTTGASPPENRAAEYTSIQVEHEGPITWLTLDRPARLNALDDTLLSEFSTALRAAEADDSKVVVIRGAGRAFSTGFDIASDAEELGGAADRDATADHARLQSHIRRFFDIWDHPKPVIAAVHGYCLAGATQLCVFCDLTIVAEDAVIGGPSLPLGGGYVEPLWVHLIGAKRAKQMAFVGGSTMTGKTAAEWGWANKAVTPDRLYDDVRALAFEIAKVPADVLRIQKLSINRVLDATGFRATALALADLDAILHASESVRTLQTMVRDEGMKEAIRKFQSGSW